MRTSSEVPVPGPLMRPPVACSGIEANGDASLSPGRNLRIVSQAFMMPPLLTVLIMKLMGLASAERKLSHTLLMPSTTPSKKLLKASMPRRNPPRTFSSIHDQVACSRSFSHVHALLRASITAWKLFRRLVHACSKAATTTSLMTFQTAVNRSLIHVHAVFSAPVTMEKFACTCDQ